MILGFWLACTGRGCVEEPTDSASGYTGTVPCGLCDGLCYETYAPAAGVAHHVEGEVNYPRQPPTSGDHNACWADWGEHTEQVAAENWVHNMEHGGVVFLHDCPGGSCPDELSALEGYTSGLPDGRWVLTPYAPDNLPFAVVSWELSLELGCLDLSAVSAFYDANVGHGPEDTTSGPSSACM